jgi:protein-tyrosine phosphatase
MANKGLPQDQETIDCMAEAIAWCVDALKYRNNVLFVHCRSGRHRSASLVYGVLRAGGWSEDRALTAVLARPGARPLYLDDAEQSLRLAGLLPGIMRR